MLLRFVSRVFCEFCAITSLCLFLAIGALSAEIRWDRETVKTVLEGEIEHIQNIAGDKIVVASVVQHNNKKLAFEEILRRDRLWQKNDHLVEFKESLISSDVGQFVETIKNSKSYYTEVFIADDRGALVSAYPLTSDYWQGDEEKWSTIARDGWPSYVSAITFDESSESNIVHLAVPVRNHQKVVGVLVVGIRLSHVLRKQVQKRPSN